jgi:7,8-dihydroneopterin aldolase/epimerase/oxygenase
MTNVPSLPTAAFLQREARTSSADQRREAPVGETMDLIFIEGFEGETVIGVNHDELNRPQAVRIDLVAGVPRIRACDTDRIRDTIDYGAVHQALTDLLASHKVRLLEALAEAITRLLIDTFGAHWVRVVLVKPRKFANVSAVGVAIERRRPAEKEHTAAREDDASVSYLWRTGPTG